MIHDLKAYLQTLRAQCREEGTEVLDFWLQHSIDWELGGICTSRNRGGSCYNDEKPVWFQGRSLYGFALGYNQLERVPGYLDACEALLQFLNAHCFIPGDEHGKMYFLLDRHGKPLETKQDIFSECFALMGMAEYYRACGKEQLLEQARTLYAHLQYHRAHPAVILQPDAPNTPMPCPMVWLMMLICGAQTLRRADAQNEAAYTADIAAMIAELDAVAYDAQADAYRDEGFDNPGHNFEVAWFLMAEGMYTHDRALCERMAQFTLHMYDRYWDTKYGGMPTSVQFTANRPAFARPNERQWWVQNETILALFFAYAVLRDPAVLERFRTAWDYTQAHFIDRTYGEWYASLLQDGTPRDHVKGTRTKGPFHVVRQYAALHDLLGALEG